MLDQAFAPSIENKPPFFVIGVQRSGTTMLRLMLNSHRNVCVPFESKFIIDLYQRLADFGDLGDYDNRVALLRTIRQQESVQRSNLISDSDETLLQGVTNYPELLSRIFSVRASKCGKIRWGDKTPSYVTEIHTLRRIFPGCRIIHLVRDGRDVAQSLARVSWGSRHIPIVASYWQRMTTAGQKQGETLGDGYLLLRFEELVTDTATTLQRVCDFLDEPFDAQMINYHLDAQSKMPPESMQWHRASVQAPDSNKVLAWKHEMSKADVIIFEQIAGNALDLFGYERGSTGPTLSSRVKSFQYQTFKRCYRSGICGDEP